MQTCRVPNPVDLEWGAFTENAPWELDRSDLAWAGHAEILRREVRNEIPRLTTPGKIPPLGRLLKVVGVLGFAVIPWITHRLRVIGVM